MNKFHSTFPTFSRWKLIHASLNTLNNIPETDLLPSKVEIEALIQFVSFDDRDQFVKKYNSEGSVKSQDDAHNKVQIDSKMPFSFIKVFHHNPILRVKATFTWLETIQDDFRILRIYPNIPSYLCINRVNELFHVDQIHNSFYEFKGNGIHVGLLDSGIDTTHPDLSTVVYDTINLTNEDPGDFNGHGTMMAGIIAGSGRASNDFFHGIAPKCQLLDIKVFSKNGEATIGEMIEALDRILDLIPSIRPQILVFGGIPVAIPPSNEPDLLVEYCQLILKEGIMIIAPTGNFGPDPGVLPRISYLSDILVVGTTDFNQQITSFSGRSLQYQNNKMNPFEDSSEFQMKPDCFFPGINIVAPRAISGQIGTVFPENENYNVISGTSASTAIAAGFSVILKEAFPKATTRDLIKFMRCKKGEYPNLFDILKKAHLYHSKPLSINKWIGIALLLSLGFCTILLSIYYLFQIS
jgi:subtilisin family serine protease